MKGQEVSNFGYEWKRWDADTNVGCRLSLRATSVRLRSD